MQSSTQLKYSLFLLVFVIAGFFLFFTGAGYDELLSDKKKQLEFTEKQIIENKNSLSGYSNSSSRYRMQIDSLESAINALNNFLKNYENETYMSPDQVAIETNMIIFLAEEVENIQESFKHKVTNLYKRGKNYELELLLSAKTPNEYLRRNQYLQKFSQNRKKELRDLKSKKFILEEKKKMLTLSTSSQRFYVEEKRSEKIKLEAALKDVKIKQSTLDAESDIYAANVQRYEIQLNNIKNFINNLESNKDGHSGGEVKRESYNSFDLGIEKGKINLPVDIGVVTSAFGNVVDISTFNKSFNNGINLSIAVGSKVYAVGDGIVTLVGELPYYGKVIIIKHESGYRTVYACLDEANVTPGSEVKLNQAIGKSGATLDGQMIHFELWQNDKPMNPQEWLKF